MPIAPNVQIRKPRPREAEILGHIHMVCRGRPGSGTRISRQGFHDSRWEGTVAERLDRGKWSGWQDSKNLAMEQMDST